MGGQTLGVVLREQTVARLGTGCNRSISRPRFGFIVPAERPSLEQTSRSNKRQRDWDPDLETTMDGATDGEVVVRVARRVYVGNLSWKTSWQDLKDFFSRVGTVKYADVLRESGPNSRSKGCGIVEFETPEEAAAAIQELNHAELDGRQVFVREDREDYELRGEDASRPAEPRQQKRARSDRAPTSAGAVTIGRRVWVGNLSFDTSWQQLKDHFKAAGHVLHADIMTDGESRSKGCGIVEFEHPADALRSISLLSNSTLNDRQIMVREDREDPGTRGSARGGGGSGAFVGGDRSSNPPHAYSPEGAQIVVHGIPLRMAWQDLKDLCRKAGTVVRADVMTNNDGTSKGYGIVAYSTPQDAAKALSLLNGMVVEGRVLTAKYDKFAGGQ